MMIGFMKKYKILLIIISLVILVYISTSFYSNDLYHLTSTAPKKLKLIPGNEEDEDERPVSNILFWIKYFNKATWYLGSDEAGPEMLKSINCPVTKCFFTHDKNHLPNVIEYDAILFHGAEYMLDPIPAERSAKQLYVYTVLEPPYQCRENLSRYEDKFFNLTMTYRFDSDILWHYGSFYDISTKELIAPSINPKWKIPEKGFYDPNLHKLFAKKQPKIAWFTSNCNASSKRDELAAQIQKYIKVDIYGKCGTLACAKNDPRCSTLLKDIYIFYLSFENALCKDYVTEKLYRPMNEFVIPIVFNGANTSQFVPPRSYIDANDFKDVESLVTYLKYLMGNSTAYLEYFWWKQHYSFTFNKPIFQYGFCDLCMKIRNVTFRNEKHEVKDIKNWWENGVCSKSHIEFQKVSILEADYDT